MRSKSQVSLIRTNIRKHIACSYDYILECVGDKFSKPFKSYLGEDTICNFIDNMIEESKYFSQVILTKNL